MMDPKKLQCLTTAAWLRGYADTLSAHTHASLIYRLNKAADLLADTWDEYAAANGYAEIKVPRQENNT